MPEEPRSDRVGTAEDAEFRLEAARLALAVPDLSADNRLRLARDVARFILDGTIPVG